MKRAELKPAMKLENPITGAKQPTETLMWRFFSHLCHQRPDRSFYINGRQMPLCARCLGVYSGLFSGLVLGLVLSPIIETVDFFYIFVFVVLAQAPMFIDGTAQARGYWTSTNPRRLITGLLSGISLGMALGYTATTIVW